MVFPLIGNLIKQIMGVIDKAVVDKDQVRHMKHDLEKIIYQSALAQAAINQQEAAHKSLFVAGWRPFVGWVCGLALFYKFLGQPLLVFILVATNISFNRLNLPNISVDALYPVLLGMLGLGGLRTFEKIKGIARDS